MGFKDHIDDRFDLGIIGGGASGIVASIFSSEKKIKIGIFEAEDRVLKKVLRTGDGKCNLTNRDLCLKNYYGDHILVKRIISRFPLQKTIDFFKSIGIKTVEDYDGRIYPYSRQSSSVVDSLRFTASQKGVKFLIENRIEKIEPTEDGFFLVSNTHNRFFSKKLIVSVGGISGIKTKEENFFKFLTDIGVKINKPFPCLVQLRLDPDFPFKSMQGCKWEAGVILNVDGENLLFEKNDIIFTDYGISGNAILNISREAVKNLLMKKDVKIFVDLLPDMDDISIEDELKYRREKISDREIENLFLGWINKRIGIIFLKHIGFDLKRKIITLTDDEIKYIVNNIHRFTFKVEKDNGFFNAQVMAGGVITGDLDENLQHKKIKNLYFSGEILDVDGKSGGYNLQWAWSSGSVAGSSAIKDF